MAHKKIIDSVKKQGQVTIKDLDEFLRFVIYEYDMRTFDANYISMDYIDDKKMGEHLEVDCPSHLIRDADVLRRKGISVTRISAFAKPEDTQRFVCKHPNLIKQVEKGTNMFDVFVFPIDCITRIRAGEKVLWTNPTT